MENRVLNYRVFIVPDKRTGTEMLCYTAYAPILGIAADGDTIEDTLKNIKDAIKIYVTSLEEDGEEIPYEPIEKEFITTTSVEISSAGYKN